MTKFLCGVLLGALLAAASHFGGQYFTKSDPLTALGIIRCGSPWGGAIVSRDGRIVGGPFHSQEDVQRFVKIADELGAKGRGFEVSINSQCVPRGSST